MIRSFRFECIQVLSCLAVLAACSSAGEAQNISAADTAITNVHVLDGTGAPARRVGAVLIEDGLIAAILPQGETDFEAAQTLDGGDGYLVPGFIDAHVHILVPRCQSFASGEPVFDRQLSEKVASALLDFGITTVRSPATPTVDGLALRDDLNAGVVRGPQAKASAEFINDSRMSEAELRDYVRDAMAYKPDYFKVYARLSKQQVATVIDEAHRHGVPVIGHLGKTSWREGAELGIDFLTHAVDWSAKTLPPESREAYETARRERGAIRARLDWLELLDLKSEEVTSMIEALVAHDIPVDPTLVAYDAKFSRPTYASYRQNPNAKVVPELFQDWSECSGLADDWTEEDYARWRGLFPKLQALVKLMHERGVTLITGSDTPNEWVIPGEGLHQELELLVEAGLSPAEVLSMTGEKAARALGFEDRGVVAAGKRADLVLLSENPMADIRNTREISWVMQTGDVIFPRQRE